MEGGETQAEWRGRGGERERERERERKEYVKRRDER